MGILINWTSSVFDKPDTNALRREKSGPEASVRSPPVLSIDAFAMSDLSSCATGDWNKVSGWIECLGEQSVKRGPQASS